MRTSNISKGCWGLGCITPYCCHLEIAWAVAFLLFFTNCCEMIRPLIWSTAVMDNYVWMFWHKTWTLTVKIRRVLRYGNTELDNSVFTDNLERGNVRAFSNPNPGTCFSEGNMIFLSCFLIFCSKFICSYFKILAAALAHRYIRFLQVFLVACL